MAAVCRIGDLSLGENVGCNLVGTAIVNGSPTVFANGAAVATVGSNLFPHFCFRGQQLVSHTNRTISVGSPTVFVNGSAVACIGAKITAVASPGDTPCTDSMRQGSPTVFAAI